MCFALTLGICVQVKTIKNTNSTISQNQEANELRDEILRYKERYDNRFKELEEAEKELEKEREEALQRAAEKSKNAKSGSLAAKANLVRQYNESNHKDSQKK